MITNVEIFGVEKTIVASGYPKVIDIKEATYSLDRAKKLSSCKHGTGHDNFLKGIIVQADITAPLYWWPQFQRYNFVDIISSQSKMHCLHKFKFDVMCNEYVDKRIIEIAKEHIANYNNNKTDMNFMLMTSNVPSGFKLAARITTNCLQLKTIYLQRKNHKLIEWKTFCTWICSLEIFKQLFF
ncbi:MAG: hypothetical protein PHF86_07220 [Candidatus Nanoarchaeia archaeon]|jgi:hypothetical protein|nr:hypothetical protein [Candidatus Nanoarchaeia archaeon]